MKKILVPTDFSKASQNALDYALMIAKKTGAELYLLHVGEIPSDFSMTDKSNASRKHFDALWSVEAEFNALEERSEKNHGVKLFTMFTEGAIIDAITETANSGKVDLIVMGATGETKFSNKLFGSITTGIIGSTKIPVIIVPKNYEVVQPDNILLALADPEEELSVLNTLGSVSRSFKSNVTLAIFTEVFHDAMNFIDNSKKVKQIQNHLKEFLPETVLNTKHISGEELTASVNNYVNEHNIQLVTMITHRRNLPGLLSDSKTRKMSINSKVPLLAIPSATNEFLDSIDTAVAVGTRVRSFI